mmetsp:Transcript_6489/g.24110  ORF Transcript_6489/g.24110 Transcript_6489/m.24110 type:complete len:241 (+) Transcript_6489:258-980(+)
MVPTGTQGGGPETSIDTAGKDIDRQVLPITYALSKTAGLMAAAMDASFVGCRCTAWPLTGANWSSRVVTAHRSLTDLWARLWRRGAEAWWRTSFPGPTGGLGPKVRVEVGVIAGRADVCVGAHSCLNHETARSVIVPGVKTYDRQRKVATCPASSAGDWHNICRACFLTRSRHWFRQKHDEPCQKKPHWSDESCLWHMSSKDIQSSCRSAAGPVAALRWRQHGWASPRVSDKSDHLVSCW